MAGAVLGDSRLAGVRLMEHHRIARGQPLTGIDLNDTTYCAFRSVATIRR